jgi:AraC-like DNA-binding protein
MRHAPCERLSRHPHEEAFAAVVLCGGYVEAGDTGRHALEPGDVVLHRAWESHLDRFDRRGAEVLLLAIGDLGAAAISGCVADPDTLAHVAERDPAAAARQLLADLEPKAATVTDWPDLLSEALRSDPGLCLGDWAAAHGLHPGSVSRGFRKVFGITPAGFRIVQRTHRAVEAVRTTEQPLQQIAQECGFADQAHMSRAIRRMARTTPLALRRAQGAAISIPT